MIYNVYSLLIIFLIYEKVPGERVIGVYSLDELREYVPIHLKPTSEVYSFAPHFFEVAVGSRMRIMDYSGLD